MPLSHFKTDLSRSNVSPISAFSSPIPRCLNQITINWLHGHDLLPFQLIFRGKSVPADDLDIVEIILINYTGRRTKTRAPLKTLNVQ